MIVAVIVAALSSVAAYAVYYANFVAKKPKLSYAASEQNLSILEKCKILKNKYYPSLLLSPISHLHTIVTLDLPIPVSYRREVITASDGEKIALDWSEDGLAADVPTVILLPGLTGGSHKWYCKRMVRAARARGLRCVVFNFRGCAQALELTGTSLYNAADVTDVIDVLAHIHSTLPASPLYAIGFSIGANFLVQYLGRVGTHTPLRAAVALANPFDCNRCMDNLEGRLLQRSVYNRHFASMLSELVQRNHDKFSKVPGLDMPRILRASSVREFDELLTVKLFSFKSSTHYYTQASSAEYVDGVQIPLLVLNAADDPISRSEHIPMEACKRNPNIIVAVTEIGGHVAWRELFAPRRSWGDHVSLDFLSAAAQVLDAREGSAETLGSASRTPTIPTRIYSAHTATETSQHHPHAVAARARTSAHQSLSRFTAHIAA